MMLAAPPALPIAVEMPFGRSIDCLVQKLDGVSVMLSDGTQRNCSLLVGCDGNRSNTRRLVFDADDQFTYFMGAYFSLKVVRHASLLPNHSQILRLPGRTVLLNGYDDRTDIGFGFRTEQEIEYDYRDRARQRRHIESYFYDLRWKAPAMLASIEGMEDFYFDRINQIGCLAGLRGVLLWWAIRAIACRR
jgi:2-polyprenyl-6-methoxyphenol hydroxylase-like FAD-dependent oxidoreductase